MSVSAILLVLVISKNVFDNAQFQTGEADVSYSGQNDFKDIIQI